MSNINIVSEMKCTGCYACRNVCPVDAVKMRPNYEGFIMPVIDEEKCIDCGKCERQCPALHTSYDNLKKPKLYAAMAKDEVRSLSSSGGVFTLAANAVLDKGGYVCGAAFDDNMSLNHIIINSKDQLQRLRGSKYVQSSINTAYREIEALLKEKKPVLFTGTPCQAAGLKAYLNKDYDELFIIDIICHGVPSQELFKKYLKEISAGERPVNVNFRDKRFGWLCESIRVEFESGREYVNTFKNGDFYEFAFHRNIGLRKSCGECGFAVFPRQGDISVGDFWGVSRYDKSMTDHKGPSLVFINNEKGQRLFDMISGEFNKLKEIEADIERLPNRVQKKCAVNKNRDRFINLTRKYPLRRAVRRVKAGTYDIGLVSNFYAGNFGGALTQYALYHVLEDSGYSVLMIERPKTARGAERTARIFKTIFIEAPYPEYAISPMYENKEAMRELNKKCNTFIVGSDQLFQYSLFRDLGEFVTLDWVEDSKKKIAYAASYGHGIIWGAPEIHSEMAYFMKKFDAFSVREDTGVEISKRYYGVDAEWVLDPVFLCDIKHYYDLANKSKRRITQSFIGGYILDPDEEKRRIFKYAMRKLSLPCEIFSEYNCSDEYLAPLGDLNTPPLKTEERLQNIINSDFFITDSFHGTCFAIIMKKPFISIINEKRGGSRFESLLSMLHLEGRLIRSEKDLELKDLFEPIDYDEVYKILEKEKRRCKKWLIDAVKAHKVKAYSDYDMMVKLIEKQNEKIDYLTQLILGVVENNSTRLDAKTNLSDYLELLNESKDNKLIVISVKDTPGLSLNDSVSGGLTALGLKTDLRNKHSRSYIAVINRGTVVYESLGEGLEPSLFSGQVGGHSLRVVSRVFKNGNESVIDIDGTDYSVNQRGLNIAVFNEDLNILTDAAAFDTHVPTFDCHRK